MPEKQAFPPTDGVAEVGDTLVASPLSIVGPARVQWKRNGVDIPGAVGRNYIPTASDLTAEIRASLSFIDARGNQETKESNPTFTVKNYAVDWPFAEYAAQYPGQLPGPWKNVSRTGLGTRVDSAGLVGFGPHNLLTQSNDFSNAAWTRDASGAGTSVVTPPGYSPAPDGSMTASRWQATRDASGYARLKRLAVLSTAAGSTWALWVKTNDGSTKTVRLWDGVEATFGANKTVTPAWEQIQILQPSVNPLPSLMLWDAGAAGATSTTVDLSIAWSQVNTASLTEYVPTTTAARYLPRITHDPALDVNGNAYTVTEQYGAELITNGDFQATLAGWTAGNGNISGVVTSGEAILTANGSGSGGYIQDVAVTPGRTYRFRINARKISGPDAVRVQIWDGASFTTVLSQLFDLTTAAPLEARTIYVKPATSTLRIYLFCATSCVGGFDDASITEYLGTVTTGTPRPLGLLVEGQGTNLASTTFTNWTIFRSAAPTAGPDGFWSFVATGTGPNFGAFRQNAPTWSSSTAYCYSTEIIPVAGRTYEMEFVDTASGFAGGRSAFTFSAPSSAPTIVNSGRSTGYAALTEQGAWLIWITFTTQATPNYNYYATACTSHFASGELMKLKLPQLETGLLPTSRIPNPGTGSAVRVADDWFLSGAAFTAAIDPSGGTFFVEFFWAPGPPVGGVFSISNNTNSNRIDYRAGQSYVEIAVGGVVLAGVSAGMSPQNGWNRIAVAWSAAGYAISLNGGAPVTGTANCSGLAATQLQLGNINPSTNTTFHLGYPIRTARSFRGQYITGAALQALTA